MKEMKEKPSAVLIGDLVGSRRAADRSRLHERVTETLAEVNATFAPAVALAITVGDEFQGTFADVGTAPQEDETPV